MAAHLPAPWHASSREQQWLSWPLLFCRLDPCLVTPPGESHPGNSERQPRLVSVGQVPLSSAKHQNRPNREGPGAPAGTATLLWEEARQAVSSSPLLR